MSPIVILILLLVCFNGALCDTTTNLSGWAHQPSASDVGETEGETDLGGWVYKLTNTDVNARP